MLEDTNLNILGTLSFNSQESLDSGSHRLDLSFKLFIERLISSSYQAISPSKVTLINRVLKIFNNSIRFLTLSPFAAEKILNVELREHFSAELIASGVRRESDSLIAERRRLRMILYDSIYWVKHKSGKK